MPAPIRVAGALPEDPDDNGLIARVGEFIRAPLESVWAVCRLTTAKITTDFEAGRKTPMLRVEVIEPAVDELTSERLEEIASGLRDRRTNARQLPLDAES